MRKDSPKIRETDFEETFAPVASYDSLHLQITLAVYNGLDRQ